MIRTIVHFQTKRRLVRVPGPQGADGPPAPNTTWDLLPGKPATFPPTIGAGSNQAVAGNDPRLADARTPTGAAGGVLAGTFPNPGFATPMATAADVVAAEESAKEYADTKVAALASTTFRDRGGLDCSANPNYPAAVGRDIWTVTGAGKIGGVDGPAVEIGDTLVAVNDSVSGNHATVGGNFRIGQTNIPGLSAVGVALGTLATPVGPRYIRINADGSVTVMTYGELKTALALEKADVGLSAVDNTSDADKPVSTAQATALAGKQDTLPAGSALQVLRRNAANTGWECADPSGGGSVDPDFGTYDDNFAQPFLSSKWYRRTVTNLCNLDRFPGELWIYSFATTTELIQDISPLTGDWEFTLAMRHLEESTTKYGGLILRDGSTAFTGKSIVFGNYQYDGGAGRLVQRQNNNAYVANPVQDGVAMATGSVRYHRVTKSGTNLLFYFSTDGVTWTLLLTEPLATHILTVAWVGIYVGNNPNASCVFSYFRKTA